MNKMIITKETYHRLCHNHNGKEKCQICPFHFVKIYYARKRKEKSLCYSFRHKNKKKYILKDENIIYKFIEAMLI